MLFDFFFKPRTPQKLPFSTDIHSHVIPGIDDGSPDVDTSLFLLERMAGWGLTRIFASPHSTQDRFENTPQTIAAPFARLCEASKAKGLGLELHHHMEYRIDEFFIRQFENNNLVTLPGNFLLIENAYSNEPWGLDSVIYELTDRGFTPVLAHPERYQYYSRNHRTRYSELHDKGLYFQVNLLSLAGYYGKLERETALYLLRNGMVQFVGTDIHRAAHIDCIDRYLRSRQFMKDCNLLGRLHNDSL